jgi:hypothetical protein
MRHVIVSLLVLLLLGGCIHQAGGVAPSTKPLTPGTYDVLGDTLGRDCLYNLLMLFPITGSNVTKTAVENAIRHEPGATALINVTVDNFKQYFVVFSRYCTAVHGVGVREH